MIGGQDICFLTNAPIQVTDAIVRTLRVFWRGAIVENAETNEILDFKVCQGLDLPPELPSELFVYKNMDVKNSWVANGAIPGNSNSMIHIIRGEGMITVVVDDSNIPEMLSLIEMMREFVCQGVSWS